MSQIMKTFIRNFNKMKVLKQVAAVDGAIKGAPISVQGKSSVETTEMPSANSMKIKPKQEFFQRDDGGMPSYLKAGMRDKHLFNVTLLMLGVGIVMSLETVCKLIVNDRD